MKLHTVELKYCDINSKKMQAIIVATRGFAPNDSTIIICLLMLESNIADKLGETFVK